MSDMPRTVSIICSDEPRNGKTLFARLLADCLSLGGTELLRIFDTDHPHGGLAGYFPASSDIVEFSKTGGQVRLFDTIMAEPGFDYVIDLQDHLLEQFFSIFADIGFAEAASSAGISITVYYLVDRHLNSVERAARLARSFTDVHFVPVRNEALGNVLSLPQAAKLYHEMPKTRDLALPRLSIAALNRIDEADFTFARFIESNGSAEALEMRIELWNFLESVYNQRQTAEAGGPVVL